jgi:prepilin-type N-terminal cleavage/methylation domain-containing protein
MKRLRADGGFTMIEVLVAILILALGSMATFTLLSSATRNAQRAKASQVALDYAEQEMELLRSMKSDELALNKTPVHTTANSLDPDSRVLSGTFGLRREPVGNYQTLVVNEAAGAVDPGPEPFTSGDVSGEVYRYIVWRADEPCGEACKGLHDYKQIVVAVKLDTPPNLAAERGYVEVQSNFVDPGKTSTTDPVGEGEGEDVTAQQFYLTDTPCSSTPPTAYQPIPGSHLLHNTLGTCQSGAHTGTTPGAPDTLMLSLPPDPDPADPTIPAEYDYANDFYLDTSPDTGTGVQIRKDDTNGCHFEPTGTTNPESQIHRWETDPMEGNFVMKEKVTLEFYTKSLNNTSPQGQACVFLYKRHEEGSPTLLTNPYGGTDYWTYSPEENKPWPQEWTKVRLTMAFNEAPYTIPQDDRLGVALSVERANTSSAADALSFMYDHPAHPSRLEIETTTPIAIGG